MRRSSDCLTGCFHIFHLLWILAVLFGFGIVGLQMGLRKRHLYQEHLKRYQSPVTIPVEELVRTQPKEGWFIVTGVTTNAVDAAFRQKDPKSHIDPGDGAGMVEKVIIPAYGAHDPKVEKLPQMVLVTDNLRLRKVVNAMQKLGLGKTIKISLLGEIVQQEDYSKKLAEATLLNDPTTPPYTSDAKIKKWVAENKGRLKEMRTVEGLVRTEEALDFEDGKLYKALRYQFGVQHVVLEEGVTPKTQDSGDLEVLLGQIALVIGSGMVLFIIGSLVKGIRKGAAETVLMPNREGSQPIVSNQLRTYSYKDAQGNYHVRVDEQTLVTLAKEKRISMKTIVQVEGTGEKMSVSALVKRYDTQ